MSAADYIIGWPQTAYVGQKVVCVEAVDSLKKGAIYEIAFVGRDMYGVVGFMLNNIPPNSGYTGFKASRFRPLRDTTHQVEALKRLCNPTPEAVA